ncbi:MAG: hypothetical protein AMJ69_09715 [Gammaproteobacteria bacterium SG8_47]|nr:MAG: hypothetical protein AMJ69_09715 [Gammaproteobacteria bacterium SG8_47]
MRLVDKAQRGITLVELMVAIAIFIIILGVGLPGMYTLVRNNQLSGMTVALFSDLSFARSEALKRRTSIQLCKLQAENDTCDTGSNNWSNGWIVFIDAAGGTAGEYDAGVDTLLKTNRFSNDNLSLRSSLGNTVSLTYRADGSVSNTTSNTLFALCDDRDDDGSFETTHSRTVKIYPIGRGKIVAGPVDSCLI